jgi:hypothetical protein
MDEELLNCVQEICCGPARAESTLVKMFHEYNCRTPEECSAFIFKNFTLSPRSFVEVKKEIGRLAKA